jgi:hypothetical protein
VGYQRTTLLLEWPEGHEFHGLEVRMRRLSIGRLTHAQEVADRLSEGAGGDIGKALGEVADVLADGLLSWNLEEEVRDEHGEPTGEVEPVPADRDGLEQQDFAMLIALLLGWLEVAVSVPLGSKRRSTPGDGSANGSPPQPPAEESWASLLGESQESIAAPA